MVSNQYLVVDSAQFRNNGTKIALIGMHLHPLGHSLVNIPETIPEGAILLLDDRILPAEIDTDRLLTQLSPLVSRGIKGLFLDFQREKTEETAAFVREAARAFPEITTVPPAYGETLPCKVVLPPIPLHSPPENALAPWKGREVWVEQAHSAWEVRVDGFGTTYSPCAIPNAQGFLSERLCCRYRAEPHDDHGLFTLWSTPETLTMQAKALLDLGVTTVLIPHSLAYQ